MAKLTPKFTPMSADDLAALNSFPRPGTFTSYTLDEARVLTKIYYRYFTKIAPTYAEDYQRKADRYLNTNKKPSQVQAIHHALRLFADLSDLDRLDAQELAAQLWSEMTNSTEIRKELILKMYDLTF